MNRKQRRAEMSGRGPFDGGPEPRIADAWASFRDEAIEPDAPPVQLTEMRRAFHAGAIGAVGVLIGLSGEAVSEADFERRVMQMISDAGVELGYDG